MLREQNTWSSKQGELLDYSLEELAAGGFVAIWKKPGPQQATKKIFATHPENTQDISK